MLLINLLTKSIYINQFKTNRKQFKIAVTVLTGFNGIFIVTDKNNIFFTKSITDDDGFIQITIPPGAYELESLKAGIKRNNIDNAHYTELNYPFTIKPNFSTLGSIIEISTKGAVATFVPDDSIKDLLGFNKTTIFEE